MKFAVFTIVLAALASSTSAGTLTSAPVADPTGTFYTRTPQFDSAVIKSDRLGGNFAYSVAESHAYTAHTPIIQQVKTPVAVTYNPVAPIAAYSAPAYYTYNPYYSAAPTVYSAGYY